MVDKSQGKSRVVKRSIFGTIVVLLALSWLRFTWDEGYPALVQLLGKPGGQLVPDLNKSLFHEYYRVRYATAMRLVELQECGIGSLPAMQERLRQGDEGDIVWLNTLAATSMGTEAIDYLALACVHESQEVRRLAQRSFAMLPADVQAAAMLPLTKLTAGEHEPFSGEGRLAIRWIGSLGENTNYPSSTLPRGFKSPSVLEMGISALNSDLDSNLARDIAKELIELLNSDNSEYAKQTLFFLGEPAVEPLSNWLDVQSSESVDSSSVRLHVYEILGLLGSYVDLSDESKQQAQSALKNAAAHENPANLDELVEALMKLDPNPEATIPLIETIRARVASRFARGFYSNDWCEEALMRLRKPELDKLNFAIEKTDDSAWKLVRSAALLDPGTPEARELLRTALSHPSHLVRVEAARSLFLLGGSATESVPILVEALNSEEMGASGLQGPSLSGQAAQYLGEIGPAAKEAVPALINRLQRNLNRDEEDLLINALTKIAPDSEQVAAVIQRAWEQTISRELMRTCEAALERMRTVGATMEPSDALQLLKDPDSRYARRWIALRTLAEHSEDVAIPLAEMLTRGQAVDPYETKLLFHQLGRARLAAIPTIIESALGDSQPTTLGSIDLLVELGPEAKEAVPALLSLMEEEDESVRIEAETALMSVSPQAYALQFRDSGRYAIILGGGICFCIALAFFVRSRLNLAKDRPVEKSVYS